MALLLLGYRGAGGAVARLLVAAEFASYAAAYLVISLRLGGATRLFQWIPFGATAALAAVGRRDHALRANNQASPEANFQQTKLHFSA
jgi:hypothetical protein